ncbi:ABC transporter permease [Alicyclobacillus shizuokensis]|uniref:ABC transporter permease n=1 Tax=Alicyclobacillus shizuokensis TaxID=392014 RepID=UPI00082EAC8D|nr:ABC transporter permease [Alicyclobacillus shizuokensis]MCL6624976.1 ABC transporter permease [Alicyclobacillus shizuokensis]
MAIAKFLTKRIIAIIITTAVIIALSYILMYIAPGSFFNQQQVGQQAQTLAAENPQAFQAMMNDWKERYGLDQPLYLQIWRYIYHCFTLNFGTSFENPTTPIMDTLKSGFPISFILALGSVILSTIVGIPLGILAAVRKNTWVDYVMTTLSLGGQAIPSFVFAVLLMLVFGVLIPIFPISGWGSVQQAVLPIIALAVGNIGNVAQYMRSSMIDTMGLEFIRTARAKGVPEWAAVLRHAFPNSLIALVTVIGPQFAFTVVGTVWIENLFSIPGLGSLLNQAFGADDFPLAITYIFILCLLVMITNLLVDICYTILDPRIRLK